MYCFVADESDDSSDSGSDDDDGEELHPLLQAHRRPVKKIETVVKKNVPKESIPEPELPTTTTVTVPKATGKIEDLARVYMTVKYQLAEADSAPIIVDDITSEEQIQQLNEAALQNQHAAMFGAPPPPPPPPGYVFQPIEGNMPQIIPVQGLFRTKCHRHHLQQEWLDHLYFHRELIKYPVHHHLHGSQRSLLIHLEMVFYHYHNSYQVI